jgi:hypothetical protein
MQTKNRIINRYTGMTVDCVRKGTYKTRNNSYNWIEGFRRGIEADAGEFTLFHEPDGHFIFVFANKVENDLRQQ